MSPRVVYKYAVPIKDEFELGLPASAVVVRFASQNGDLFMWAIVDTYEVDEPWTFYLRGTGHELPGDSTYVASCQHGVFVWHLFERVRDL